MIARHERALLSIAALSLAMVFAIYLAVRGWGPLPGELRFEEWRVDGGYPTAWDRPLSFVTYLADPWVGVGMVIVLTGVVADELGWRTALLVPAAAASALLSDLLKAVLGPTSQEYGGAAGINLGPGANYPSGHAAYAVAVYGLVAWLAHRSGHRGLTGALALPVVLMGPALALLGNHYPADIVAGYALGLGWLLLVLLAAERLRLNRPEEPATRAP